MKARVPKIAAVPTALLYHLEDRRGAAIAEMCSELGIRAVCLDSESAEYPVGYLCGLEGFSDDIIHCGDIPQCEALVLSSVDRQQMNALLAKMRRTGNTVALKCVVTDINRLWALGALIKELQREHAAMNG